LIAAIVIDCAARGIDAARYGGFRDDSPAPDGGQKLVLGDNPVAVGEQKFQKIEDLRLKLAKTCG
jgi:hypothetical protein